MGEDSMESPAGSVQALPVVRFFISSPGDVVQERNVALSVIRRLQTWFQGRLVLVPILWEQEPLLATAGFQQEIDRRAPPSATDVAIFVLWARLGTPLSQDFALEDGRRPTGTEWEFEDAARAFHETALPHILVYRKSGEPMLRVSASDYEIRRSEFSAVERFFQHHFREETDLSFKGSFHAFEDPSVFGQLLESHLLKLLTERHSGGTATGPTWAGSPFRGLETFDTEHAQIFFGRTRAIQEVRQTLAEQVRQGRAFVLILGPSGNGKSSLARAGLLPILSAPWVVEEGTTRGFCRQAVMKPGAAASPLASLCDALMVTDALPSLAEHGDVGELAAVFAESPRAAVSHIRGALRHEAGRVAERAGTTDALPARLVLVVDQLEEVFTREGTTDADRDAFSAVLDALARSGDVWVLSTLRSDFYPALSQMPLLMALKDGGGHYDLALPDAAETGQIIRGPAQVAGRTYEIDPESGRALDDVLLTAATRGPDALPLLEYTLTLLDERRRGDVLTFEAYEATGGLEGAIGSRAEAVWEMLPPSAQAAFPSVLRALVEAGSGATVTGRRARRLEVSSTSGATEFLDRFLRARLLVAEGAEGDATIAVAHEAVLRAWPRAAEQIEEERELLRIRTRVRAQTAAWDANGRDTSLLLPTGTPLGDALLLREAGFDLTELEIRFVAESEARALRGKRLRRAAVGAISVLALLASAFAFHAERSRARAESAQAVAEAAEARTSTALHGARSVGLAGASREALAEDPMLALILARDAVRAQPTSASMTALHEALAASHERACLGTVGLEADLRSLGVRGHLPAPHREGMHAEFSPQGDRVLTTGPDGKARLWSCAGRELAVFEVPGHEVSRAAFSPDGGRILTTSTDGAVRLWDREGSEGAVLRWPGESVGGAVFSPGGPLALTVSTDGIARLRNLDDHAFVVLGAHPGEMKLVAVSPGGERFATASDDGTVRLWDVAGREVASCEGHEGKVCHAVFAPGGDRLATASRDKTVRLWDAEGNLQAVLRGHEELVTHVAFSPRGDRIATASYDDTVRLWDLEGDPLGAPLAAGGPVYTVAFSPDGARVVAASGDGTARIWSSGRRQSVAVLRGHKGGVWSACFSPEGTHVLSASGDGTARIWAVESTELAVLRDCRRVQLSPRSDLLCGIPPDGIPGLWSVTGDRVAWLRGHDSRVEHMSFARDGRRVLTLTSDHTARLWDDRGREVAALRGEEGVVQSARFSPQGDRVLALMAVEVEVEVPDALPSPSPPPSPFPIPGSPPSSPFVRRTGEARTARLWDMMGQPGARVGTVDQPIRQARFVPDGRLLLTTDDDATALWDLEGRRLLTVAGTDGVLSPTRDHLLTRTAGGKVAHLWDRQGRELAVWGVEDRPVGRVRFSPSGDLILTHVPVERQAGLWDLGGRQLAVVGGPDHPVDRAEFSPSGAFLRVWAEKPYKTLPLADVKDVRIVDLQGRVVAVLPVGVLACGPFSPEGDLFTTKHVDHTVSVWDSVGRRVAVLRGHTQTVQSIAFSSDAGLLLTASPDGTTRLWDQEGREVATLRERACDRARAGFSLDGRLVLTHRFEGLEVGPPGTWWPWRTARLWYVHPEDLLRQADERITRSLDWLERQRYADLLGDPDTQVR